MKTKSIEINGIWYPVRITIEDRNDVSARIGKKGIVMRIPSHLSREEISRQIIRLKSWARQKIMEKPGKFKPAIARTYADGDVLQIGNEQYLLKISFMDKQSSSARIDANAISLAISSNLPDGIKNKHISTLLSRCIAAKRIEGLRAKINELNLRHFNQKVNRIFFKYNKSSWGSCSENGNINISTRLLFAPSDVLEYVCVHELAHLIEPNHSDRFWELIEKAMPDYREKEGWLKENGDKCIF